MPATIGDFAITAVLGYVVVFVGLALLMLVIMLIGKLAASTKRSGRKSPPAKVDLGPVPSPPPWPPAAPGSAGQLKLYNVSDREAAILMAIVADKMGKPLNELRFKSIKEVKEDEV